MLTEDIYTAAEGDENLTDREYNQETASGIHFGRLDIEEVRFSKCRFTECNFSGCAFRNVTFENCDFSNCTFKNCYFFHTVLQDCKGDGADFSSSTLVITEVREGSYRFVNFALTLWDNCLIENSDLGEAFLSEVKLKKTKLEGVNLARCDFFKTMLKGIDLSGCVIDGITVSDTFREVQGVKLNPLQAVTIAQMLGVKFI